MEKHPPLPEQMTDGTMRLGSLAELLAAHNKMHPDMAVSYRSAHQAISSYCTGRRSYPGDPALQYEIHHVPKRSGGLRTIHAPNEYLKSLQRFIMQHCLDESRVHPASFAYQSGKGIADCANAHLHPAWLIKVDLKDFFQTVRETQVYQVFASQGYPRLLAFEMARLCTVNDNKEMDDYLIFKRKEQSQNPPLPWYRTITDRGPYPLAAEADGQPLLGRLPQGSPASGMLANLAARDLDEKLSTLAERENLRYTRYSDDLFFSVERGTDTASGFTRETASDLIHSIYGAIYASGFVPNTSKTKVLHPGARKCILGLQVEDAVRLTKKYKKDLEYHIRGIDRFGLAEHVAHQAPEIPPVKSYLRHVEGLVAFAKGIEPAFGKRMERQLRDALARPYPMGIGGLSSDTRSVSGNYLYLTIGEELQYGADSESLPPCESSHSVPLIEALLEVFTQLKESLSEKEPCCKSLSYGQHRLLESFFGRVEASRERAQITATTMPASMLALNILSIETGIPMERLNGVRLRSGDWITIAETCHRLSRLDVSLGCQAAKQPSGIQ